MECLWLWLQALFFGSILCRFNREDAMTAEGSVTDKDFTREITKNTEFLSILCRSILCDGNADH
jgi:hypothetical protein